MFPSDARGIGDPIFVRARVATRNRGLLERRAVGRLRCDLIPASSAALSTESQDDSPQGARRAGQGAQRFHDPIGFHVSMIVEVLMGIKLVENARTNRNVNR